MTLFLENKFSKIKPFSYFCQKENQILAWKEETR